jgi:hypothetical protein
MNRPAPVTMENVQRIIDKDWQKGLPTLTTI